MTNSERHAEVAEVESLLRRTYAVLLDAIDPYKGRSAVCWMTDEQADVLVDVNDWLKQHNDGRNDAQM